MYQSVFYTNMGRMMFQKANCPFVVFESTFLSHYNQAELVFVSSKLGEMVFSTLCPQLRREWPRNPVREFPRTETFHTSFIERLSVNYLPNKLAVNSKLKNL